MVLWAAMPAMAQPTPSILLIAREPLMPGADTEYDRIESETALLAARLNCPHPYLALQPLTEGRTEVWWFNEFDSQDQVNAVGDAYKTNKAWSDALAKNQQRKAPLTGKANEELADLVPQAEARPWAGGRARFVVVAVHPSAHLSGSQVFQGRGGTRYEIFMTNQRAEAERVANGTDAIVLEVVPRWSFPASAWVEGNRELWNRSGARERSHGVR